LLIPFGELHCLLTKNSENQDKVIEAADVMNTACSNCHEKYREKATLAERCQ